MDAGFPIPLDARLKAFYSRSFIRTQWWEAEWRQRAAPPRLAVIGCYDTGNVGDLALGWTLRAILLGNGLNPQLQPLGSMERYPIAAHAILGGGGVLTLHPNSPLPRVVARYASNAHRFALVGVSGLLTAEECSPPLREFLAAVPFLSVRSNAERRQLSFAIGRDSIRTYPDIAFGLPKVFRPRIFEPGSKILGVSVSPVLLHARGSRFIANSAPSAWFNTHLPQEAEVYDRIGASYIDVLRATLQTYLDRGWAVRLIPFAVEDHAFARAIFRSMRVEFVPYTANPIRVFESVSGCSRFIATRFHSHVFALSSGVPCLSISYSPKCRFLWDDLNLPAAAQISPLDLVRRRAHAVELLTGQNGIVLDATSRADVQDRAIEGCLAAHEFIHDHSECPDMRASPCARWTTDSSH